MKALDLDRLPNILTALDGSRIATVSRWESQRRPEITRLFTDEVYGRYPPQPDSLRFEVTHYDPQALGGTAIQKSIKASFSGPLDDFSFPFWMFIPKQEEKCGAFILIFNSAREDSLDITRQVKTGFWPVEEIVSRGYAAVAFRSTDLDTEADDGFVNGVHRCFSKHRGPHDWATIAAWAWGGMRVMDYLVTDEAIDAKRVGIAGHSRGGKTALFCAASDPRFRIVYSCCSGCVGAALSRFKDGESIQQINDVFPYWFCDEFKKYNGREFDMPFDQHMLLAAIAPRLLYVSSATDDDWADPEAEFASTKLAGAAYSLYGLRGIDETAIVRPDEPTHGQSVGYHRRQGDHDLTASDWKLFMDFADSRL